MRDDPYVTAHDVSLRVKLCSLTNDLVRLMVAKD